MKFARAEGFGVIMKRPIAQPDVFRNVGHPFDTEYNPPLDVNQIKKGSHCDAVYSLVSVYSM